MNRFVEAQAPVWDDVQAELRAGHKTSHWMWFIFPQLAALGRSGTAKFYGLSDAEEAKAYLAHPVLGTRLVHCCELLLAVKDRSALDIFGGIDAMKLRSSLTLFDAVAPAQPVFRDCLERYFDGEPDGLTLGLLQGRGAAGAAPTR
ncbi:DUF1810 domain-containing protein [Ramlibacter albus]|uniref:DUF1810 domain-containing protein n=1 Tax=Ramlibacter albus TaxID=2079448 RepID=A0A923M8G1_9BURK|nr:DUF1810 domain-containing protein [Ramlibacter albus]MBC5764654.1 DUF1810 domain-containing protein [Ramlibacter albus]